jgi:class 3 adenylate cyclase
MELLTTYIPIDRNLAMRQQVALHDHAFGAMLVADISGFTPLTEALLQTLGPKRGAEELTRQINQVYEALIPEIHRYHGSVISFGGDAITCWFAGDDGLKATACAFAMQHEIARFAASATPSGMVVSLAIKSAIATGPVRRFLVGDPLIQVMDVIAGSTLDRLAAAERCASKGDVVLDEATAAALHEQIDIGGWCTHDDTGARVAVLRELRATPASDPWPTVEGTLDTPDVDVQAWILPPVYERLRAAQGQFLGEIRPAVALFLRFGGIDYDSDSAAGARLDAYIRWVQNVLRHYEGFLLQVIMGDKGSYLYAAFGAPLAHDDDPARAVAAALDLLALPPELDYISGVQVGITRGMMHAGAYGSSMRHTYGVLGDEVNLAARLMARAEPGQILVTGRIAYSTRHVYDLVPLGLVQIKGKTEPVPVSLVRGRKLPVLERADMLFDGEPVGRERELAQLERTLALAQSGSGQIIRLEGVAGIGKSQISAAFSGRALRQGLHVVPGACQSISRNIAYAPWRQMLWALLGLSDTPDTTRQTAELIAHVEAYITSRNPDWLLRLPLLGDVLGLPIPDNATTAAFDPRLRQEALFALVIDMLRSWAHEQPLLLLLEDAHWIDEASLDLTLAVSRVLAQMPVLLAVVQRPYQQHNQPLLPELFAMPYHHHVLLGELSPADVGTLVCNRLQAQVAPLALEVIQYQAQGNPFFTEELLDALLETGKLCRQPDHTWNLSESVITALRDAQCLMKNETGEWVLLPQAPLSAAEIGIPDSIHGIVLSRLDRLPENHKLTLKVASVIGRIFEFEVLARVHPARTDPAVLLEQIDMAEARDFTRLELPRPHLTYIFRHNITQEVAYETLLESQQRDLHSAVGEALEALRPDAVERIAYHYSRGGVREKALFYLDKAARKTQREYANETALAYYTQALALEEHWEWRQGQVEILHTLGRREEQQAALLALETAPQTPVFVAAHLWGQYYEAVGAYAEAQQAVERGLEDAGDRHDTIAQARALSQLGSIAYRQGEYESSRTWYTQAMALFRIDASSADGEASTLAETLNGLGAVYNQQGIFEQAQTCFEDALQASRATGHRKGEADALNNLGIMFRYQRRLADALAHYREALEMQRAIGDRSGEGASLGNMAQVIQEAGDYGQAETYLQAALVIQQAIGNRWNEINNWNDLGILYQELGDLEHAQECLQQGLDLSQRIGDEAGEAYILVNLGLVAHERGQPDEARRLLSRGLELAQDQDDMYLAAIFLSYLGVVSLHSGQIAEAIDWSNAALVQRRELDLVLDTTYNLATLAVAHMQAGRETQALDYARKALAILDECGGEGPESPQRDYFLCAQVLEAASETDAARAALQSAYDLLMARADKLTDPAMRQSFLEQVDLNRQIVRAFQQTPTA